MTTILPPLKIVYYTTWFNSQKFSEDLKYGRDCPLPEGYAIDYNKSDTDAWCTLTSSHDDLDTAAGLMFHAVDAVSTHMPLHKPNQPWILESLETPNSSPFRANTYSMSQYQYLASYNFKAAFLFSYFSPGIMDIANRPLPKDFIKTKTKSAPILWIARNCHATNGREKYIEKLMEYVDVHSYGSCLNNKPFPDNKSRMDLLGEYKFYLSIENSNCDDYATEKLFDTMMMSSVPIVDGPPTYDGYIPNNRSVIYMDAYPDPKDLADYIQYLHNNDTAYLEYLAYRTHALDMAPKDRLDPDFISNWSDPSFHQQRSNYCAVCRGMLPWWAYHSDPHQTETYKDPDQEDYVLVDQSCAAPGKWNYILDGPPYHPTWTPRPRDEFTRPGTVIPETTPLPEATSLPETDHHSSVLIANLLFVLFFFMFLGVLFRLSKKESSQLPV